MGVYKNDSGTFFYRCGDLYLSKSLHFEKISLSPSWHFGQWKKVNDKNVLWKMFYLFKMYIKLKTYTNGNWMAVGVPWILITNPFTVDINYHLCAVPAYESCFC